ncbi:5-demethoxyubiquinol-8 5-hydroxylase UbiM [Caulobacter sp. RHG1]|uniref:5-demethoxyubiquinol-8 5-hydroxylase UbiM n=1 Tax=Caulobacter sp. (strain RHG1) TaxID=2545762 RepID=UPI00155315EA|nr:5-demethoxyubiquinol-8 5-hydroxylase UbiM [Caulobacter sp. RHG1]NQE62254.1 Ubiquinone biosynthesis hydroxylase, UbiH/UbiF/VisC/COQ6 family [Caulobacter sp. RHG1]
MNPQDIAVIGAGPAGLAFTAAMQGSGLKITLIERLPRAALADPAFDGREIALTQRSIATLKAVGAWDLLPADDVWPLRAAKVLNGASPLTLTFEPEGGAAGALGALVANHHIRRALFQRVDGADDVTLLTDVAGASAQRTDIGFRVDLGGDDAVEARLLVVADSRFSTFRDQLGVGADMNRLGRSMLVCRMTHDTDHGHVATEWFDHGQTLAVLPLGPGCSSIVVTLAAPEIDRLMAMDEAAFEAEMTRRHKGRLGALKLVSTRHAYPLVTTWSHHFAGPGFALIGDAAVGMHPVTAHGFNLGLLSAAGLARRLRASRDIAALNVLSAYESEHRRAALPLYTATNAIARLYATETTPAKLARHALLQLGRHAYPARRLVSRALTAA